MRLKRLSFLLKDIKSCRHLRKQIGSFFFHVTEKGSVCTSEMEWCQTFIICLGCSNGGKQIPARPKHLEDSKYHCSITFFI